jgi:hypothetical protein
MRPRRSAFRSSSDMAFIAAVAPGVVLIAIGFAARWR